MHLPYCTKVDNVVDLKQHIVAEWAALDHSIIPSANAQWSLRLRLHACIRAAGEDFEHCLLVCSDIIHSSCNEY